MTYINQEYPRHRSLFGLSARFMALMGIWVLACMAALPARAELRIDITRGKVEPMPVAITDFLGTNEQETDLGRKVTEVISRDLQSSGLFRPIDPKAFIQKPEALRLQPRFADWRVISAQALVLGRRPYAGGTACCGSSSDCGTFAEQQMMGLALFHPARKTGAGLRTSFPTRFTNALPVKTVISIPVSCSFQKPAWKTPHQAAFDHGSGMVATCVS